MQYFSQITNIRETEKGTDLILHIPGEQVQNKIIKYRNGSRIDAEIRIEDGRTITPDQRKKIFATIRDIAEYTGDHPEGLRAWLLYQYCAETGEMLIDIGKELLQMGYYRFYIERGYSFI